MDLAYKCDLHTMLSDRVEFVVPPFQRHYVWTAEKWTRLWDDILETARRRDRLGHFFGAIVVQHEIERAGDPKTRAIVDGQQRLTTVQVLLAAGGAPLRPSELVRNHIFHQCAQQGLDQRQTYNDYWESFDDGYWFDS